MRFILELLTLVLDICKFNLYVPLSDILTITDFLVPNQEVGDRLFHLFQAGASLEFIRHYAKHFRKFIPIRRMIYTSTDYYYSIHHCEALVFERNKDFMELILKDCSPKGDLSNPYHLTQITTHGNLILNACHMLLKLRWRDSLNGIVVLRVHHSLLKTNVER